MAGRPALNREMQVRFLLPELGMSADDGVRKSSGLDEEPVSKTGGDLQGRLWVRVPRLPL